VALSRGKRYAKAYKLNVFEEIDAIHSEIVADCMFDVFSNERFVNTLVKENKTLAQKICDFIKELLSEIRNMMKNYHNSPEMEALRDMKALLDNINNIFVYELEIASKNAQKAKNAELQSTAENREQKNNTTEDGGVKYSIKKTKNMDYAQQIELVENEKLNGSNAIYIGEAPASLIQVGFSNYPFAMNQSDYRKSRRTTTKNKNYSKHGVKRKFFEQLPQKINDAIMFIDNGEKVTVITDSLMLDSKGQPSYIIAGIMKNQKMDDDFVNQIKSVYPLDDFANIIRKNAENGKLVIINKNKANDLLAPIGIQPSQRSRIINLAKSSLSQVSDNVNENQQNNAEIKKSLKLSPDAKKVLEENPELKSAFLYLQSQFKLVKDYVPSEEQLTDYAKQLKKSNASTKDVYEIKNELRNIYSILHSMTDSRDLEYATCRLNIISIDKNILCVKIIL